jgi:hypothetical protein
MIDAYRSATLINAAARRRRWKRRRRGAGWGIGWSVVGLLLS